MANEKRLIDKNVLIHAIGDYMATNAYLNDTALDVLKLIARWADDAPTVDAVEVRHELRKAVALLNVNYEKALGNPIIRDPLAWALFQTWKKSMEGNTHERHERIKADGALRSLP